MGWWGWVAAAAAVWVAVKVVEVLWWRPRRVEEQFARQGIRGPRYRFLVGCVREMVALMVAASAEPMPPPYRSHNVLPRVLAFYHHWKKIYGSTFLIWFGPTPRLAVADPELIREVLLARADRFDRYESHPMVRQLEGEGLVSLRGEKWAHHRRVLTPAFHMDNLRLLLPCVGRTVVDMADKWRAMAAADKSGEVEIDVSDWFQVVTEDAITRTAFGRSYEDGKVVFKLQAQLMAFASEAFRKVFIPGYRFLPTKKNTSSWKLDKEIRKNLVTLIGRRQEAGDDEKLDGCAKDLLGLMINAASSGAGKKRPQPVSPITVNDIVEECKTFFFAGKQTTSNLLTWAIVVLAMHPEWQERARQEVVDVCGAGSVPSREQLAKLKTLGMILNETLRLYPPAVATVRRAKADVELGGYLKIPRDTELLIPIMAVHHDARLWGPDAAQFNPARFADGAARAARHPTAFIPFGLGARMCIGQNLAILEAKLTIAIILERFDFRLSPNYVHAPTVLMLLHPQYGAPIVFRPRSPCQPADQPQLVKR
ncbi:cytochrome P450 734A6 [Oryza brachyantha]|uniref:cytochrome P450 734A6 n=1 Tax=Oryza brachyantha TaxID=4533 RepID=UPI001ADAB4F0|nr:cytochrome P450 734A6 [Oryza brachyantha]